MNGTFFEVGQIVKVNEWLKVQIIQEKPVENTPYLSVVLAAEVEDTPTGFAIPQYITWLFNSTLAGGKGGFAYGHYFNNGNNDALKEALDDFIKRQ